MSVIMVAVTQRTLPIPGPTDLVSLTGPGETPRVCSASDLALSLSFLCTGGGTHGCISHPSPFFLLESGPYQPVWLRDFKLYNIWGIILWETESEYFPRLVPVILLGRGASAWQWPPVSRVLLTACSGACSLQSAPHCRLCRTQSASLPARTILCITSSVTQPKFQRNLLYRSLMRWVWREERCQREASGLGVSTVIL